MRSVTAVHPEVHLTADVAHAVVQTEVCLSGDAFTCCCIK